MYRTGKIFRHEFIHELVFPTALNKYKKNGFRLRILNTALTQRTVSKSSTRERDGGAGEVTLDFKWREESEDIFRREFFDSEILGVRKFGKYSLGWFDNLKVPACVDRVILFVFLLLLLLLLLLCLARAGGGLIFSPFFFFGGGGRCWKP